MTPKETAFKLYFEFYRDIIANSEKAKQCAVISVKNILNSHIIKGQGSPDEVFKYWSNVINEINKL
ncbi:hypothetical protein UFOVP516_53 [uncultured Caudovirales phage]|uniref:Uncharacterized protein n=1 Tax=uncultured Caudovirales phage TaxID=2100421 RepID=A0A6J5MLD5_9CAUD|nr:hypothetical protein UFOVP516_53 [uncultured Caudovirales phage]